MSETKPTCPYCGSEMAETDVGKCHWYVCMDCSATSPCGKDKKDALEKAQRRAPQWHSVKEGLPGSGTICVVHGHNKLGLDYYDSEAESWSFGTLSAFDVEHWMPVPDAPKEDEE